MDINLLLLAYAIGKYSRDELESILTGIGFSETVIGFLMTKADHRKLQVDEAIAQEPKPLCDTGMGG